MFWVGVVYLVVKAIKGNSKNELTDEEREDILKSIYTYMVLFVTLMMTIGGSVSIFMGFADYVAPSYYVEPYENFRGSRINKDILNNGNFGYSENTYQNIVDSLEDGSFEDGIREDYDLMVQTRIEDSKRGAVRQMIQSLGWIIVPLPVFIFFQKQRNSNK